MKCFEEAAIVFAFASATRKAGLNTVSVCAQSSSPSVSTWLLFVYFTQSVL